MRIKGIISILSLIVFSGNVQAGVGINYKGEDKRPFMIGHQYSAKQIDSLDKAFADVMRKATTKRDKVVAAADFLATLPYAIPFSYESHREGYELAWKYTRKGLFLKEIVENGRTYPSWGCEMPTVPEQLLKSRNIGSTFQVGFHCSSFVRWCLYNADAVTLNILEGSWANDFGHFPGADPVRLKDGLDQVRPGDLLYFWVDEQNGHVAVVLGIDGDTVTFAESANWGTHQDPRNGVRWRTFDKKATDFNKYRFKYLIKMAGVYKD